MIHNDKNYFINNPIFVKYKTRFDFKRWQKVRSLKTVRVNERIIEIPFTIAAVSDLPADSRVLDLGCSESPLPLQLAALGYRVTGFDFRPYPYHHPNLQVVQGDILKLPFEPEYFDAVLSISTLEHLGIGFYTDPQEIKAADQKGMAEIRRVLKKGGQLILTVPYGVAAMNEHQRVYGPAQLAQLLSGWQIVRQRFFASTEHGESRSNYWEEIAADQAARIASPSVTQCVGLVQAIKIS